MLDLLEFQNLPIGETRSGNCPECGKRKFYVTRKPDGFVYICHRATCGLMPGFVGYYGPSKPLEPKTREQVCNVYRGNMMLPDWTDIDYFLNRFQFEIGDSPMAASYLVKVTEDNRYAFPVWGPREEKRGVVLRRPIWSGEVRPPRVDKMGADYPKSLNYFEGNTPCGWYHSTDESKVIITEDPVSAMRISFVTGVTCACIYGTHLQDSVIQDLKRFGASEYIFALDPDATGKAIHNMLKLLPHVPNTRVSILEHDPKDYELDIWLVKDLGL